MGAAITIDGFVGRDVEVRTTAQGLEFAQASVAVSHYRGRDHDTTTSWFRVTVFGNAARSLADWRKGDYVVVTGDLELKEFTTRDGGRAHSAEITARAWTNTTRIQRARSSAPQQDTAATQRPPHPAPQAPTPPPQPPGDDYLPF